MALPDRPFVSSPTVSDGVVYVMTTTCTHWTRPQATCSGVTRPAIGCLPRPRYPAACVRGILGRPSLPLDASTGNLLWNRTGKAIFPRPRYDGVVYASSSDGHCTHWMRQQATGSGITRMAATPHLRCPAVWCTWEPVCWYIHNPDEGPPPVRVGCGHRRTAVALPDRR